jgi:hypothetical protein
MSTALDSGTEHEGPTPARERGWLQVLLALAAFLLVPAFAWLRVVFPVEQTILLVGPAIAVCALVSWVQGGRAWLAVTWFALSGWMLLRPLGDAHPFEFMARGWSILLVAMFGVVCVVGGRQLFLRRALTTVAATFVFASAVIVVTDVSPMRVQRTLADELDRRAAPWNADWQATRQSADWQQFTEDNPSTARFMEQLVAWLRDVQDLSIELFPALLALESLMALALAWGIFHRISRARLGPPLGRIREFRFADQLVWGLLAGVVFVVMPSAEGLDRLGWNLILFFGGLYAVRSLGVLAFFVGTRRLVLVALTVLLFDALVADYLNLMLPPATSLLVAVLGLGDTWIDWRGRARQLT